jgi:hypothetical protein
LTQLQASVDQKGAPSPNPLFLSQRFVQRRWLININAHITTTHTASQAIESLRALPAEIDEAALSIDKSAKKLSKSDAVDRKAREKMLMILATL